MLDVENRKAKIIFFGSTNFSQVILKGLIENFDIVAVITQPDKPFGRKQEMSSSPVKKLAIENKIKVLTPGKLNDEFFEDLKNINADLGVVAAYGKIIPERILNHPEHGCINVHGSLLPKYRGATPVPAALRDGLRVTGISLIKMTKEMDAGEILSTASLGISEDDNVETLLERLAHLSVPELVKVIPAYLENRLDGIAQNNEEATYCYISDFSFEKGQIDWRKNANEIFNHIRAFTPQPRAWTLFNNVKLFIIKTKVFLTEKESLNPGKMYFEQGKLLVECGSGILEINELQMEGKKIVNSKDFRNGYQKDLPIELGKI